MILTIHRHVISRIPRYSITYDNANTWLLHVNQAQQDDRGYYMCQVNTNPMISQVGYLQVVGKLKLLNYEKPTHSVHIKKNQLPKKPIRNYLKQTFLINQTYLFFIMHHHASNSFVYILNT